MTNKPLEALRKLGDSSSLNDIERNELETSIRTALERLERIDAIEFEGIRKSYSMRNISQEYNEGFNAAIDAAIARIKNDLPR